MNNPQMTPEQQAQMLAYIQNLQQQQQQQQQLWDQQRQQMEMQEQQMRQQMQYLVSLFQANGQAISNQPIVQNVPQPIPPELVQQDTGREPFYQIIAKLAAKEHPEAYRITVLQPGYDIRYWSYSIPDAQIIYTQYLTKNWLTKHRVLYNEHTYSELTAQDMSRRRTQYPELFTAIDDPNYNPRVVRNRYMASGATTAVPLGSRLMTQKQLKRNLESQALQHVRNNPNAQFLQTSLLVGTLRAYQPPVNIPGLEALSERTFFNGIITETEYDVNLQSMTRDQFIELIRRALVQRSEQDINGQIIPPYYSVFLWYVRPESEELVDGQIMRIPQAQQRAKIFSGTMINSFSVNMIIRENLREEILETTGSDNDLGNTYYLPDWSKFIIQKIDLVRTGGNTILLRQLLSQPSNSKNYQSHNLGWCVFWNFRVTNNTCFVKILFEVLKMDKLKPYDSSKQLWTALLPQTVGHELSFDQAADIASRLKYDLFIYNPEGELVRPGTGVGKSLRVLFYENHYMLIREIFTTAQQALNAVPKVKSKDRQKYDVVPVYFDLETVYVEEAGAESNLRPYGNAWIVEKTANEAAQVECKSISNHIPTTNIFDNMIIDMSLKGPKKRFIMIAYNGSGFDYQFLFSYLVRKGCQVLQAPKATGKLRAMQVWIKIGEEASIIQVWDPYLFVNKSLDQAARDFGIGMEKLPFDHEQVQKAYIEGKLEEFLNSREEYIEKYNCQDVYMLRLLTNKIVESLVRITQFTVSDIMGCSTLPGLCFKYWQRILKENNIKQPRAVKDVKYDKKIRTAVIGGRVEGVAGDHSGDFRMVDIVSLYPTVMKLFEYPTSTEHIIKDTNAAVEYFKAGCLGLYHVKYDQSMLTTLHTIVPQRINDRLKWQKGSGVGWMPSVTVQQLLAYGCKVDVVPDEDGDCAIVWDERGRPFKKYVEALENIKNEQDAFKAAKDPRYNPSLREMVKLMLNALSGKVVQRNFDNASEFVQGEQKLIEVLQKVNSAEWVQRGITVSPVTTTSAFVEYKLTDPYTRPMPSQLGVFIYAYARAYMFDNLFSKMSVKYSDTDSGVISVNDYGNLPNELLPIHYIGGKQQLPPVVKGKDQTVEFISPNVRLYQYTDNRGVRISEYVDERETPAREKQFGDLELEIAVRDLPGDRKIITKCFDRIVVISPKMYALYMNGVIVKYRLKGIRSSDEFYDPDFGWKPIERDDLVDGKLKLVEANVERLFELLAKRFTDQPDQPDAEKSTVEIRSWQFKKILREGRMERRTISKII